MLNNLCNLVTEDLHTELKPHTVTVLHLSPDLLHRYDNLNKRFQHWLSLGMGIKWESNSLQLLVNLSIEPAYQFLQLRYNQLISVVCCRNSVTVYTAFLIIIVFKCHTDEISCFSIKPMDEIVSRDSLYH